jgi:hypothetical protein
VVVGPRAEEQHYWLIEPLLGAGMDLEQIRALVVRLAVEAGAATGRGAASIPTRLVEDQPLEVQAAWTQMIGRMLALES